MMVNGVDIDERKLTEYWQIARIPTNTRYERACLAAKWYADECLDGSAAARSRAYKALDRIIGRDY